MKKISFILAALLATSVISCQREIDIQDNVNPEELENVEQLQEMTFYANTDVSEGETKTVLDLSNDHVINWAADETIYVFDGTAPRSFTNGSSTGSSNVPFTGMALPGASKYYALFPSGYFVKGVGDPTIKADIPVSQTATANSFDPQANVSIAVAADVDGLSSLSFKNVGAVVKFTLKTLGIRKAVLESLGGLDIAGEVSITLDGSNIPTASVTTGSKYVILDGGASDLSVDTPYYITVLPGDYTGGFKITFEDKDGKYRSFSNKNDQSLTRGGLMNFGDFTISSLKAVSVDNLDASFIGISSTSYDDWDDKTGTSGAKYAGNSATNYSAIQLNNGSPKGIVTTTSGGKVKKVVVSWESHTSNDRTLDIYGKNTAYTDGSDLYDSKKSGTKLGSIVKGTSTELVITGNYDYIGLRSKSGAMYLDNIAITWGTGSASSVSPEVTLTNVTNASLTDEGGVGSFIINSNVHWTLDYTPDGNSGDVTYASTVVDGKTKINVTFPSMTGAAGDSRSVEFTVTPEGGSPVSQTFTQIVRPTITWNSNGSTSTTRQRAGTTLVLPDDPSLSGYTFRGWTAASTVSSDEAGITWATSSTVVPATDVTYYAVYKLATPSNIDDDGDALSWDAVASADKYIVTIEGEEPAEANTNSYDFSGLSLADGVYSVTVVAVPASANLFVQSASGNYSLTIGSISSYTITVNQPATGGTITVKGSSVNTTAAAGESVALVATPSTGYKFTSWSVTKTSGGEAVTVSDNSFTMPDEAVTVTATFTAKKWVLVTNASSLNSGDQITFAVYNVTYNANKKSWTDNKVLGAYNDDKYFDPIDVTFNTGGGSFDTLPTGAISLTLGGDSNGWTFLDNATSKYIKAPSSAENKVYEDIIDNATEWGISISSNDATITGPTISSKSYNLQYYKGGSSARFNCYGSNQQKVRIYRYE